MQGKLLDMNSYPRRAHFDYFRAMTDPYAGVTVNVDVTELVTECKQKNRSFFLAFLHIVALAANDVPELRQRICGDGIVEYPVCDTSHIELPASGAYCYCTVHHQNLTWEEYFTQAKIQQKKAVEDPSIEEDDDVDSLLFISCVRWLNYVQLKQPVPKEGSNPRITWGKYEKDYRGRLMMPVSLFVHHSLVDGVHLGAFYSRLDELLQANIGCL